MCELYGFSGNRPKQLNNDLKNFFSHAKDNPDGWGMTVFNQGYAYTVKEKINANKSHRLDNKLAAGITATSAIAHIRLATIGYDEYNNTHPFIERDMSNRKWVFAHNGTIFEGDSISKFMYEQKGSTDSERVLLYIISKINLGIMTKGRGLNAEERFEILEDIVEELSPNNKLNLLIYDGEILYVHTNAPETLYYKEEDEGVVIATKPIDSDNWEEVDETRLLGYVNGKLVYKGRCHGQIYVPNEDNIKALFLAYSNL